MCDNLNADEQEIIISNGRRKWGKIVTLMTFNGSFDANLEDILKKAKKAIGSGGTVRGNSVEVRGDHRFRMKKFLIDLGYDEQNIFIMD